MINWLLFNSTNKLEKETYTMTLNKETNDAIFTADVVDDGGKLYIVEDILRLMNNVCRCRGIFI